MAHVYVCVLLVALCVQYANADCSPETLEKIKGLYNGVDDGDFLKTIEGDYTFVYVTDKGLAGDCLTVTFKDNRAEFKGKPSGGFDISVKDGNLIISDKDKPIFIGHYLRKPTEDVQSLYVCSVSDSEPIEFGGVAVKTAKLGSDDTGVESAKEDFAKIGVTAVAISPCS